MRKTYNVLEITDAYPPSIQTAIAAVGDVYLLHSQREIPTLRMLEQAYGEEYASRVWIKTQIVVLNDFVGVKNKLDDCQINPLCDQILVEYGGLNLLEFCLFVARLRSGKYEQFYGSVDPMLILKSLDSFMEDRRLDINRNVDAIEKAKKKIEEAENEKYRKQMFESYRLRIPNAETDEAPVDFAEYHWGGLYKLTDEELQAALVKIEDIRKADKPSGIISNIASSISNALGIGSGKNKPQQVFGIIPEIHAYVESVINSRTHICRAGSKS